MDLPKRHNGKGQSSTTNTAKAHRKKFFVDCVLTLSFNWLGKHYFDLFRPILIFYIKSVDGALITVFKRRLRQRFGNGFLIKILNLFHGFLKYLDFSLALVFHSLLNLRDGDLRAG